MEENNFINNLSLSVKDINYICGGLKLMLFLPIGNLCVDNYDLDYNFKLYTRLSTYKNMEGS